MMEYFRGEDGGIYRLDIDDEKQEVTCELWDSQSKKWVDFPDMLDPDSDIEYTPIGEEEALQGISYKEEKASRFQADILIIGATSFQHGGEGSGNYGHAGRPGEVGGSAAGEGGGKTSLPPGIRQAIQKELKSWKTRKLKEGLTQGEGFGSKIVSLQRTRMSTGGRTAHAYGVVVKLENGQERYTGGRQMTIKQMDEVLAFIGEEESLQHGGEGSGWFAEDGHTPGSQGGGGGEVKIEKETQLREMHKTLSNWRTRTSKFVEKARKGGFRTIWDTRPDGRPPLRSPEGFGEKIINIEIVSRSGNKINEFKITLESGNTRTIDYNSDSSLKKIDEMISWVKTNMEKEK